jgi:hypothetical protein
MSLKVFDLFLQHERRSVVWDLFCRIEKHRHLATGEHGFEVVFAFLFYAAAATVVRLLLCNGSYTWFGKVHATPAGPTVTLGMGHYERS